MLIAIQPARSEEDFTAISDLLQEYFAWLRSVGLNRFDRQGYASELATVRAKYAQPAGLMLLARDEQGGALGCAGVAPLVESGACEMKRLYVRESARGSGAGRALVEAALAFAAQAGYREMFLDTLPLMTKAVALYRSLGFEPIPPYYNDAETGALFFSKHL